MFGGKRITDKDDGNWDHYEVGPGLAVHWPFVEDSSCRSARWMNVTKQRRLLQRTYSGILREPGEDYGEVRAIVATGGPTMLRCCDAVVSALARLPSRFGGT